MEHRNRINLQGTGRADKEKKARAFDARSVDDAPPAGRTKAASTVWPAFTGSNKPAASLVPAGDCTPDLDATFNYGAARKKLRELA